MSKHIKVTNQFPLNLQGVLEDPLEGTYEEVDDSGRKRYSVASFPLVTPLMIKHATKKTK